MNLHHQSYISLIARLSRTLPIVAYPRPPLLAYLATQGVSGGRAPRLSVVDIFSAGDPKAAMCRFSVLGDERACSFVVPLKQITFGRKHPATRALAQLVAHVGATAA